MATSVKTYIYICFILFIVGSSGCSGQVAQESTPTNIPLRPTSTIIPPTPTAIPPTDIPLLFIATLDGEDCTLSGPNELPPGEYSIKLIDLTGNDNGIWIALLTGGHTRQDMLDMQNTPGEYFREPDWLVSSVRTAEGRDSDGNRVVTFKFYEYGEYIVDLGTYLPMTLWICDPSFFVVEK